MDERSRPLTEEYAWYLKALIRQAAEADRDFQVFGAGKHKYRLNPGGLRLLPGKGSVFLCFG